jgi:folate-binding protein YgfZ
MHTSTTYCCLDDFASVRFHGADAGKFLQGQLSNDVGRLQPGVILRAALHTPQGRTLALLWLAAAADGDILALLPRELAATVAAQLRRYLLRAKVTITDESGHGRVLGLWQRPLSSLPDGCWRLDAERALALRPTGETAPPGALMSREQWRALDVAGGLPQVYAATSGQFVAQMLNLDCIDAISFSKGCYTGQEVIARAHYRGRVKRRMQRFETPGAAQLAPGDTAQLEDGRSLRVVEAVARADGRCEFLAVAAITASMRASGPQDEAGEAAAPHAAILRAHPLPLPYPLPE